MKKLKIIGSFTLLALSLAWVFPIAVRAADSLIRTTAGDLLISTQTSTGGGVLINSRQIGTGIFVDTSNNVGIKTTNPGQALDVNGRIRILNSQTELYQSSNRLRVRSENIDDVANFASYGLYLPKTAQTAGLYVESPIEARGGIRMGSGAGGASVWGNTTFNNVVIVPTPTADNHAATKSYVDSTAGGGVGTGTGNQTLRHSGTSWVGSSVLVNTGSNIQINKTAHIPGSSNYHLELYSPDTGDANNEVSLRFHQGARYWYQIRARSGGFRFTGGSDDTLTNIAAQNATLMGNVGIGKSPSVRLDVTGGSAKIENTPGRLLELSWTGTSDAADGLWLRSGHSTNAPRIFFTRNNESGNGVSLGSFGSNSFAVSTGATVASSSGTQRLTVDATRTTIGGHLMVGGSDVITSGRALQNMTTGSFSGTVVVATPTDDSHAATQGYVKSSVGSYVLKSGDTMTGNLTAPRYIDSDNTAYYVDPASTSRLATIYPDRIDMGGSLSIGQNRADDGSYEWFGWYSGASRAGIFLWDGAWNGCDANKFCIFGDSHQLMLRSNTGYVLVDDTLQVSTDTRSPIFYDLNDTNYYVDPNGTTRVNVLNTVGTVTVGGGTGKLNAGTFDPIYTIGGKRYATYLPSMTGVKEETSAVINLVRVKGEYRHDIDFASAKEGSDVWLFMKTANLKSDNFSNMAVILSPGFDGRVWYKKDAKSMKLTIYGNSLGEVSYRLTAPRFDASEWSNYSNDDIEGFNLDKLRL